MRQQRVISALAAITLFGFSNVVTLSASKATVNIPLRSPLSQIKGQGVSQNSLGATSKDKTEELQANSRARQVTVGVFTFRYESCETDIGVFICHFKVTNNASEDRAIIIYPSYIVDSNGEKYIAKEAFFGDDKDSKIKHRNQINLLPHMSVKLTFKFHDVLPKGETLGFSIGFAVQGDDEPYRASFMSVPVKE